MITFPPSLFLHTTVQTHDPDSERSGNLDPSRIAQEKLLYRRAAREAQPNEPRGGRAGIRRRSPPPERSAQTARSISRHAAFRKRISATTGTCHHH